MPGEEGEAFCIFPQKHGRKVPMPEADLSVVSDRTGEAKRLKPLADGLGCVGCFRASLFDGDGRSDHVGPASVFKTYRLCFSCYLVWVYSFRIAYLFRFLDRRDAVFLQCLVYLSDPSVIIFK